MTYANSFDDFGATPASAPNGLQIQNTSWGMILKEPRIANTRFLEQIASGIIGGAFIMAAVMMVFTVIVQAGGDLVQFKVGLSAFFGALGGILLRFSLDSGVTETEVDLDRRVIRICKTSPKRKTVDQIYIGNISDVLVVNTPQGTGIAVERQSGDRADLLAVGTAYQIAVIHQRISDALPQTHG